MQKRILVKLSQVIPVMLVVATVSFLLLHITPGDPAILMAGETATEAQINEIRSQLGLDEPIYVQYWTFLSHILTGNLGTSIFSGKPVLELIGQRLEPTLMLAATTLIIAVGLAVPIGVIAGWRARTWVDRLVMGFSVLGFSVPTFIFAYVLIYFFAVKLRWFPVQGYRDLTHGIGTTLSTLVLPSIALGLTYMALIARIARTSMIEVLGEDYIRTARAKGLTQSRILLRHGLKNAAVPIVTIIGIGVAALISGVVVTETVFNIPGLGRLLVDAILARDYPVVQAMLMVFSGAYVAINLAIDIVYGLIDPRIRY